MWYLPRLAAGVLYVWTDTALVGEKGTEKSSKTTIQRVYGDKSRKIVLYITAKIWYNHSVDLKSTRSESSLAKYVINGGKPLEGAVTINGAKNAALLAIQMLSLSNNDLAAKLAEAKEKLREETEEKDSRAAEIVGLK